MKILSEYKFLNEKSIRVVYRNRKETKSKKFPDCDAFALEFIVNGKVTAVGIRPDEMVIIIRLLSDAVFKGIKSYGVGVLKSYNGFK